LAGPTYEVTSYETKAEFEAAQQAPMAKEALSRVRLTTERLSDGIMSCHRTVTVLDMSLAFTDIGFTVEVWASTAAVGAASPRTQPRVITAPAATKAVSLIHFNIVVSFARR